MPPDPTAPSAFPLESRKHLFDIERAAVRVVAEIIRANHQSLDPLRIEDVERWDARG